MGLRLPAPDRSTLPHRPLDLVVAEVRFEYTPSVGDGMNAVAFHGAIGGLKGDFSQRQLVRSGVQVAMGQAPQLPVSLGLGANGWNFHSPDNAWLISLTSEHLTLQTSRYGSWEDPFRPRLALAVSALVKEFHPAIEQRIGLRYVNRIRGKQVATAYGWSKYISSSFLGPAANSDLGPSVQESQNMVAFGLDGGKTAMVRYGTLRDLESPEFLDYVFDCDIYRADNRDFDLEAISSAFDDFNHTALQLFQAAATPELLTSLR
jgi:uncharacterized protein (TIGR04255 family)